jgi:hypothetical protein
MPRIRTIKPEFPQSESIGRLSRDARLLFLQLFTVSDDSGKARASSRMLASLLYPYDDDARELIDGWLTELQENHLIEIYSVEQNTYLKITNWLKHQKIDHPSLSRLPEPSRSLARDSRSLATDLDLGSRKGKDKERKMAPRGATGSNGQDHELTPEAECYRLGKQLIGANQGGQIKKLIEAKGPATALTMINLAGSKGDPSTYFAKIVHEATRQRGDVVR